MSNIASNLPGLYAPEFERDGCGFGMIANMDGVASHWLVETAIGSPQRLTHRGPIASDGKTGDGCGPLMKLPDAFLRCLGAEDGIDLSSCTGTPIWPRQGATFSAANWPGRGSQWLGGEWSPWTLQPAANRPEGLSAHADQRARCRGGKSLGAATSR